MVKLHDQTFRDAHQSVLATRLRTEDMLPICPTMDKIGFFSLEVWGGATFDVAIRYLNEDPWERLKALKKHMPNTPLQMLERAMNIVAYRNFPDDIVRSFIHYAKKDGCDYFRIFDALNDLRNLEVPIKAVKKEGGHAQGSLCYTISPIHTVERYVEDFKKLEKMGCDSLCIKDMAGMISPSRAYDIIKGCKDAGIKIPIDLHSHNTSGMSGLSYMRACEAGVDVLDSSISSLTGSTGQPPTESIVAALEGTEFDTGYDMDLLMEAREYFNNIWNKYSHLHRDAALRIDPSVTVHQIPGGMLSNLVFQLEQQGAGDKYEEVLKETPRVRKDFGYPPLVTPSSQLVGVQAVMNVLFGRYKRVTEDTKNYLRGMYGKPPGEISEKFYEKILGPNWRDEVIDVRPSDVLEPAYKKYKDELDDMGLLRKPEDALTYAIYPQVGLKFLKGEAKAEFTSDQLPLKPKSETPKTVTKAVEYPVKLKVDVDGVGHKIRMKNQDTIEVNGKTYNVSVLYPSGTQPSTTKRKNPSKKNVKVPSPMLGTILKIVVSQGERVAEGDTIAVLEAMKMENDITSPVDGVVSSINVKEGQDVEEGDVIALLE